MNIPNAMNERVALYSERLKAYPKLCAMYQNGYLHTAKTALVPCEDGTFFVLTGDIPAMWQRDSAAQVTHYLSLARDAEVGNILKGVIRRQLMYLSIDPYANAFNKEANGEGHTDDLPRNDPWVFERKYELDSLCYPMRLLYLYWKQSGDDAFVAAELPRAAGVILRTMRTEQKHGESSPYRFVRPHAPVPWDTIPNGGLGTPVAYTGMIWTGFRPSDDGCEYGYLTASEMFATVMLGYMAEMLETVCADATTAEECRALRAEIDDGIRRYCVVEHPTYGRIYACETDGMGHYSLIDDANIPSLLSIPYIGYADAEDEIYQNTRRFLLSSENPYYFEGTCARGIGSRHTPKNYIWHMALVMQGMTALSTEEKREMLDMIVATDADTGYLHEGFDADAPTRYTREWFTWPNSLFAEFVEHCVDDGLI